jgi:hypothetical protein
MSTYFTHFPIVSYNGVRVREITRRTNFIDDVLSNPFVFLPYTVKEGEKPEDIAHNYYGSVEATWVVMMANNIVDPYTQWPMTSEVFADYIISKYAIQSGLTGYDVIAWTQNETSIANIVYYYKTTETGMVLRVSPDTFPYVYNNNSEITGRNVPVGWSALRIYDHENDINENKREIVVVEQRQYEQINKEFKRLIKA